MTSYQKKIIELLLDGRSRKIENAMKTEMEKRKGFEEGKTGVREIDAMG